MEHGAAWARTGYCSIFCESSVKGRERTIKGEGEAKGEAREREERERERGIGGRERERERVGVR